MIPFRRQILLNAFKLFDLLIMAFSFALATSAVYYRIGTVSFSQFLSVRVKVQNFALFLALLLVWHIIFSFFGLYESRRLSNRWDEVMDVVKATTVGTLAILLTAVLFRIDMITPLFLAIFAVGSTVAAIAGRLGVRFLLARIRMRGRNLRNMVVVGTNPRAVRFARNIEGKPELGYRLLGFVDEEWPGIEEFRKTEYSVIADLKNFPSLLREKPIDEVVVSLPMQSLYQKSSEIVGQCEEQGIIVRFLSDVFNLNLARARTDDLDENPVVSFYTGAMHGWPVLVKRALDFSLSLISLIILAPMFLVVALLIKVTSPGPVFYIQSRRGLNKRPFKMIKFRTMVNDADKMMERVAYLNQEKGPAFKIKNDPRITKVGKFLRRMSIDELPQLFNVLKGEMSLVGPRPLFDWEFERIENACDRRRYSVRPGVTGLWQVNGRSNVSFDKRIQFDLDYIDNWSLGLDLKILAKTALVVATGRGAF